MAIHLVNGVSTIYYSDSVTILIETSPEVAADLRRLLAKVNSEGVGDTPGGVRQLLHDTEAALNEALRVRRARPKKTARLQPVCQLDDCGCSGPAHP